MHTSKIPLGEDVSLESLTHETEHYTGADLEAVCREVCLDHRNREGEVTVPVMGKICVRHHVLLHP